MISRTVLQKLKKKKIDVFVKNLGQNSRFQGILMDVTEEIALLKSRYNKIIYIPLSEIVVVTEHEAKTEFLKDKLRDVAIVNSIS